MFKMSIIIVSKMFDKNVVKRENNEIVNAVNS